MKYVTGTHAVRLLRSVAGQTIDAATFGKL